MSMGDVENLHIRVRQELERLGLSLAEAARRMGEADSQGVRDVCSGRKRVTAEFLAKLVDIQGDVLFVLTGKRSPTSRPSGNDPTDTVLLLQNRGIYPDSRSCRIHMQGLVLVLEYIREVKRGKPIALTDVELAKIATFSPTESRAWVFHPVTLTPRPTGPTNQTLLVYRCKTPVSVAWQLGPFDTGVPDRFEVSGWPAFPIKIRSEGDGTEYSSELSLDLDHIEQFARGQLVQVSAISVEQAQAQIDSDMAYLNSLPPPN